MKKPIHKAIWKIRRTLFNSIFLITIFWIGSLSLSAQTNTGPTLPSATRSSSARPADGAAAGSFGLLKTLKGTWTGKSSKGWVDRVRYEIIAAGSVVYEDSFDAHENERMMTMFYLDGNRLMLTHFCSSKTQPRLLATVFENKGRKVTFTFLDATNLPSRNTGHMDKLVLEFIDDDHFTAWWTWYQDGKENWLEQIKYERLPEPATSKDF
jgi:hypothetical protein